MDQQSALELFHHEDHLRSHVASASIAERVEARRHVRAFIASARNTRDVAIAGAEAQLPDARAAIASARRALAAAEATERAIIGAIDAAIHAFGSGAAVLELRLKSQPDPQAEAMSGA